MPTYFYKPHPLDRIVSVCGPSIPPDSVVEKLEGHEFEPPMFYVLVKKGRSMQFVPLRTLYPHAPQAPGKRVDQHLLPETRSQSRTRCRFLKLSKTCLIFRSLLLLLAAYL
jgi:hypothetical protein